MFNPDRKAKMRARHQVLKSHMEDYNKFLKTELDNLRNDETSKEAWEKYLINRNKIEWEVVINFNNEEWAGKLKCRFQNRELARKGAFSKLKEIGFGEARIYRRKGTYRDDRVGFIFQDGKIVANSRQKTK